MKASAIIRLCVWSLVAVLLIALMFGVLSGKTVVLWPDGSWNIGISGHTYPNASEYTAGNAEIKDTVRAIDLEWVSGSVKVVGYDGDVLRVTEQTTNTDPDMQLHWRYKNEVLYIQPYASQWFFGVTEWGDKNVTIELPYSMHASLTKIEVESTSASVTVSDISTKALSIDTVSGNINVADATAEVIELDSVSGLIAGNDLIASSMEVDVTSGDTVLSGTFRHLSMDSTSGDFEIRNTLAPASAELDTVSGDITLYFPLDEGFTVEFETVSGDFECDYAVSKRGSLRICGDGKGDYDVETVSGDLYIKQP